MANNAQNMKQNIIDQIDDILNYLDNAPTINRGRSSKLKKSELPLPTLQNGNKSTLYNTIQSKYDPSQIEHLWDEWWENKSYYSPQINSKKDTFIMLLPPPNVTGSLHLGHALMATIEDTITRYWRMKGMNCLWLPGTDHAGIATQTVVERRLQKDENKTRHDLGREEFLKRVWEWKEQKGDKICSQLRKLGCSLDWNRKVFTMGDNLKKAVIEAFVRLYDDGLIYRDNRLCHWSCSLRSAISDAEIIKIDIKEPPKYLKVPGYDRKIKFGVIHKFAYPLIKLNMDDEEERIIVATTRIETMLGDTAIAVHPQDDKYKYLIGRYAMHPFFKDRQLPIIGDAELVKIEMKEEEKKCEDDEKSNKKNKRKKKKDYKWKGAKGTGAVKITPAHDQQDFDCGKRNGLEFINIFTDDGKINENGGEFEGMKRYEARYAITKRLKEMGLFEGEDLNPMTLNQCSRSKDIIEPMMKPQWYMNCDDLAQQALHAVFRHKTLKILPKKQKVNEEKKDNDELEDNKLSHYEQQWLDFLGPKNIRRWCISRQLWWGHRIPAYKFEFDGNAPNGWNEDDDKLNWIIARTQKDAEIRAQQILEKKYGDKAKDIEYKLIQDEDVLDTWFSSGLLPFSAMGWPDDNATDLKSFFPGDLLETGGDILFFWVARMVMMSLQLMKKLPFHTIYLHPMVRDENGAKMSKSSGNVIDPLHIINGAKLQILLNELYDGNIPDDKIAEFKKKKETKFPKGIKPCGADALRFGLLSYLVQRSINLDINHVIGYRLFCNKIWQCTKFVLLHLSECGDDKKHHEIDYQYLYEFLDHHKEASLADRWILSRLNRCIIECEENNQKYEFGWSTSKIYQFFYHEFCDYYLELIKPTMYSPQNENKKKIIRDILYIILRESFKMMHPFMPFITEELFQRIEKAKYGEIYNFGDRSIMIESYPDKPIKSWNNNKIEEDMKLIQDISKSIRCDKHGVLATNKYNIYMYFEKGIIDNNKLQTFMDYINILTKSKSVTLLNNNNELSSCFMTIFNIYDNEQRLMDTIKIYHDAKDILEHEINNNLPSLIHKTKQSLNGKKKQNKLKQYNNLLTIYQNLLK